MLAGGYPLSDIGKYRYPYAGFRSDWRARLLNLDIAVSGYEIRYIKRSSKAYIAILRIAYTWESAFSIQSFEVIMSQSSKLGFAKLPAGSSPAEVEAAVLRDGGVIIKGLFLNESFEFNAEIDDVVSSYKLGVKGNDYMEEFAGRNTKRVTQLITRSSVFRKKIIDHDMLISYVDRLCSRLVIAIGSVTSQLIELQPGEKAQFLHRDADNYPVFRRFGKEAPEVMLNCLVALSDYTEEMGATRVIPKSHLWVSGWRIHLKSSSIKDDGVHLKIRGHHCPYRQDHHAPAHHLPQALQVSNRPGMPAT